MELERNERTLNLTFDSGVSIGIDLAQIEINEDQLTILDKLGRRARDLESTECDDGHCPAQAVLEPDEFEKVRGLYVGLREIPVEASGPIIDFCLHVINVHNVEQQVAD